jgi:hypothetical protein
VASRAEAAHYEVSVLGFSENISGTPSEFKPNQNRGGLPYHGREKYSGRGEVDFAKRITRT